MSRTRRRADHVVFSGYGHLFGPLVTAAALGLIVLICRWVFSTDHREDRLARRTQKALTAGDFGLLVPVARVRTPEDAEVLRDVLRAAGIRGTVAPAPEGGLSVLVFRDDALRARGLVSS